MITQFGKILRKMRIDHGEILKSMAEKLEMTSSYLSAIECGKRNIPADLIEKLVLIYNLSESEEKELLEARDNCINTVEINLTESNSHKRGLALQFARKFDDIDDEDAARILEYLNRKREE